jgi:ribonuclease R
MPLRYINRILDHLARDGGRSASMHDLGRALRVSRDDMEVLRLAMDRLVKDEKVERSGEHIVLPSMSDEVEGIYRATRQGYGFITLDRPCREGDLFVARGAQGAAISGDRVRASVSRGYGSREGRVSGRIIDVLEQAHTVFAGTVSRRGKRWVVEPGGRRLREPVIIRDPGAKNIKVGDKVVFELIVPPEGDTMGEGVVTEVLGAAGEPDAETEAVIAAHGLRTEFPAEAIEEARAAAGRIDAAHEGRLDLRQLVTFTIDPPDARDFDDAISVMWHEQLREWELSIHIADVAFFVPLDGPLDIEAKARGNSSYLPRRVIPMLPEVLSNGVCSLQEGVDRFAKTVVMRLDEKGRVLTVKCHATVIRSDKRFTYLEAQAWIDGDGKGARRHCRTNTQPTEEVLSSLLHAANLAKAIQKRRQKHGMISLSLPDSELLFDDEGRVRDVQEEDSSFTHTLIEMFMVEANEAVARLFDGVGVSVLRRIHPEPDLEDLVGLRTMAMAAGFRLPENPGRKDLQRLLDATRNDDTSRAIHFAVLRTLTRAQYSPALIGHFALASEHYVHFTSPIRRYPDLVVHRALEAWLHHTENGTKTFTGRSRSVIESLMRDDSRTLTDDALIELGRHCTDTENESEWAERELREFLVLQFLETHFLGEDLPGVVRGLTSNGVLVSLNRFLVTGLVGWSDLGGGQRDHWEEIPGMARVVAKGSGAVLAVGDAVEVRITRVDAAERSLELLMVNRPQRRVSDMPLPSKRRMERDRKRAQRGSGKGRTRRGARRHRG